MTDWSNDHPGFPPDPDDDDIRLMVMAGAFALVLISLTMLAGKAIFWRIAQ
ncbi:hypothetical protein [Paramagnetospirillum marisnigri]|uniref:hypothetical protein n=1 Tax=Paramagnetospirillum marisnigri TaxID=1285242 RepID=UPI000A7E6A09|nr:hypothetical protein [Paramagnetospirillum marisnigri]